MFHGVMMKEDPNDLTSNDAYIFSYTLLSTDFQNAISVLFSVCLQLLQHIEFTEPTAVSELLERGYSSRSRNPYFSL